MIRCVAIDDEPLALTVIHHHMRGIPGFIVDASFTDPIKGLAHLSRTPTDLLLLDVQMPDMDGIQLLKQLDPRPLIVLTTAHREHAVPGYDLDVVDYLLKPIPFDRFIRAMDRVRKEYELRSANQTGERITLRVGHENVFVDLDDVLYIEAFDDYVKVVRRRHRPLLSLITMKDLQDQLPEDRFQRVHRSYIVQLGKVSRAKGRRLYIDEVAIPVGLTYQSVVTERLGLL